MSSKVNLSHKDITHDEWKAKRREYMRNYRAQQKLKMQEEEAQRKELPVTIMNPVSFPQIHIVKPIVLPVASQQAPISIPAISTSTQLQKHLQVETPYTLVTVLHASTAEHTQIPFEVFLNGICVAKIEVGDGYHISFDISKKLYPSHQIGKTQ